MIGPVIDPMIGPIDAALQEDEWPMFLAYHDVDGDGKIEYTDLVARVADDDATAPNFMDIGSVRPGGVGVVGGGGSGRSVGGRRSGSRAKQTSRRESRQSAKSNQSNQSQYSPSQSQSVQPVSEFGRKQGASSLVSEEVSQRVSERAR